MIGISKVDGRPPTLAKDTGEIVQVSAPERRHRLWGMTLCFCCLRLRKAMHRSPELDNRQRDGTPSGQTQGGVDRSLFKKREEELAKVVCPNAPLEQKPGVYGLLKDHPEKSVSPLQPILQRDSPYLPDDMAPNDLLNQFSSVFVHNLKDPVPKDPLNRPKVYNRTLEEWYAMRAQPGHHQIPPGTKRTDESPPSGTQKPSPGTCTTRAMKRNTLKSSVDTGGRPSAATRRPTVDDKSVQTVEFASNRRYYPFKTLLDVTQPPRGNGPKKTLIWKLVVNNKN
ncbi:hypothetical protein AAG570_001959 [Ranatra chinensis]|uniref:Uncharacterized protein n=1 Tax=Ranatra chinensis TaxID=642074 RepID=A0ABD0YBY5_9HEMI